MKGLVEILRSDTFLIILACVNVLLIIGYLSNIAHLSKLRKEYKSFMTKLGNGKDIAEDLRQYMNKVGEVDTKSEEIINYCRNLDNTMAKCLKRVGIVRYSAFRDTGSDLSFALALLDDHNNGVVLNGIYSREMSNIYAKPVEKGTSSYTLSKEETEAINKAMNS